AKCELKQLDQLYQEPHAEFFYAKLRQNLFEKKIYERIDLGLPSESAFENLGRMLIGAINKNPKMPYLRDMLFQLNSNYPYSKETKLYTDLQVLLADLTFQEILESKDGNDVRSKRFFAVFDSAPKGSDVSKKSILNGVLIGKDVQILDRCDTFLKLYPAEFKPSKEVFDRCIRLAEQYVNLEREYSFWVSAEKELNDSQRLKFGLIELALNKTQGRKRILNLPTPASKSALQLWDGIETSKAPEKEDPRLNRLLKNAKIFRERLKPIKFSLIRSVVPARIKDFEQLDLLAVELYKSKPAPDSMAKILEMRAGIALSMRDFIKNLPAPDGLTPEELKQYQAKTNEVLKVWEDGAVHRNQECGEVAHSLSMDFKVAEKTICPEQTLSSTFNLAIQKWESTRQTSPNQAPWKDGDVIEKGESVGFLLDAGAKAKEPIRSRYFYIRALDLSQNDYDRARAYLALAKLMNKDTFWESAAALDGNLVEPIQWWRKKATGNPYFERLYDKMIGSVK
ncbi:MAG: hypothetical protein JWQ35_2676, partial [Bacteriovoracaceae bacterium]|nr:hypothetical protein [Bacteriovoracaceae bacterium]